MVTAAMPYQRGIEISLESLAPKYRKGRLGLTIRASGIPSKADVTSKHPYWWRFSKPTWFGRLSSPIFHNLPFSFNSNLKTDLPHLIILNTSKPIPTAIYQS